MRRFGSNLRVTLGDIETQPPWPKARVGAPPEMLTTLPSEWSEDIAALHVLVERVGEKSPVAPWSAHPVFGAISGQEWGLFCRKHLDYHLRQFGV